MPQSRPYVHLITPGDHFSPWTGSAVPTVVDGLSRWAGDDAARSVALVARGTYTDRYDSAGIEEYDLPVPGRFGRYADALRGRVGLPRTQARSMFAAALAGQPDWPESVLFAHNAAQAVPLVAARHRAVLYAHNMLLRTYSRREVARTLGDAAAIVCVSSALAEQMTPSLPRSLHDRVRVVRNGVDTAAFHPARNLRDDDTVHVVFVGRMIADKGADVLVEAVRKLDRSDVRVTLIGSEGFAADASLSDYERRVRRDGAALGERLTFLPFSPRPDLPGLLRAADVMVVPSRWPEPFGLTVLEGMASGLAVVASNVGGLPEAVGDGGLLVPPDDPGTLSDVLSALVADEAFRTRVARTGREHAEAHDWAHARRNLDSALKGLI